MMDNNNVENINYFGVRHYKVNIVKEKIKTFKFITNVISYALFIWLLLIGLTLLVYVTDIKIRQFKGDFSPPVYNAYVVLTGSMVPEIMPKDVVITKRREPGELDNEDIITFLSSDSRLSGVIVTHRIREVFKDPTTGLYTYQTKGDANNTVDFALAEHHNVIGEVIFRIPKVGYIQEILASKGGLIIFIFIPCLGVLSYDIVKMIKKMGIKKKATNTTVVRR